MRNRNQQHVQVLELKAKGFSIRVIGDQLGISKSTVARMAQQKPTVPKRANRDNSGTVPLNRFVPRKCVACGREYQPVREIQLYCSQRCKNREAQRRLVKRSQQVPGIAAQRVSHSAPVGQPRIERSTSAHSPRHQPQHNSKGVLDVWADGEFEAWIAEDKSKVSDPWK